VSIHLQRFDQPAGCFFLGSTLAEVDV
jgi:hypothetical protein